MEWNKWRIQIWCKLPWYDLGNVGSIYPIFKKVSTKYQIWLLPHSSKVNNSDSYCDYRHCGGMRITCCLFWHFRLGEDMWFKSAVSEDQSISSFGGRKPGQCKCADDRSCIGSTNDSVTRCNCNARNERHGVDAGINTDRKYVGITGMYFIPPPELKKDSASTITLGPLQCIKGGD